VTRDDDETSWLEHLVQNLRIEPTMVPAVD
jgi:hypothetical protein